MFFEIKFIILSQIIYLTQKKAMKKNYLYLVAVFCIIQISALHAQSDLDVQISTDKMQYQFGETMEISITAFNSNPYPVTLTFSTNCQSFYFLNGIEYQNGIRAEFIYCLHWITYQTIPANGSYQWNHSHYLASGSLATGIYNLTGMLETLPNTYSNTIFVEIGGYSIEEDFTFETFEEYISNAPLAIQAQSQGKTYWTTWNNLPGGTEDPKVSQDVSVSGSKSLLIENDNDAVLLLGDRNSGAYAIDFNMLVSDTSLAYFNVLQLFDGENSEWGL